MEGNQDIYILGLESSCDDTSAAVMKNGVLLSNITASQEVHRAYGGARDTVDRCKSSSGTCNGTFYKV